MRNEQDMRLAQSLDTPDRKAFAKEQMALRIAESRDRRHRLEDRMKLLDCENNNVSSESVSSASSNEETNVPS